MWLLAVGVEDGAQREEERWGEIGGTVGFRSEWAAMGTCIVNRGRSGNERSVGGESATMG